VMRDSERRQRIVAEALSWEGTKWGHHQRAKGIETDCAGMIAEVFERVGEMPHVELPPYPQDIMRHRTEEIYFDGLRPFFHVVDDRLPLFGDVAMFRWGRMQGAQGCIVLDWPWVIGAITPWHKVAKIIADEPPLRGRLSSVWSII
jgi:hypothetical protein